jgi:membrane-associated phospholipid phosphatase
VVPGQPVVVTAAGSATAWGRARPHEMLAAGYFALTGLFVVAFGRPLGQWWPTLLLHVALVAGLLQLLPRLPDRGWTGVLRDWLPIAGITLVYWEVARLNDLFTLGYHDRAILRIEALLFRSQPSLVLRELLPSKPLSEYLHFGYFAYYTLLPALAGTLYLEGRREAFRYALTVVLAVFLFCYVVFIAFPVAGPWYVFERPRAGDEGWLFPQMEHAVLAAAASEGAAFPSSHVAAAVAMWLLAHRLSRATFRVFTLIVPALIVGTVYGGFHYATDALSGILIGLIGYLTGPKLYRLLRGDPERALAETRVRRPGSWTKAADRMEAGR